MPLMFLKGLPENINNLEQTNVVFYQYCVILNHYEYGNNIIG